MMDAGGAPLPARARPRDLGRMMQRLIDRSSEVLKFNFTLVSPDILPS